MGQREVDDCALVDLVTLVRQHAALPEGARHIDLLTEVVHWLLEQFELIHVELLLVLACFLGSHAPARRVAVTVFIFNCQVLIFSSHRVLPWTGQAGRPAVPIRNCCLRAVSPYQTQLRGGPS